MSSIHESLHEFGNRHRHRFNQAAQWLCLPVLVWSLAALLWLVPVPPAIGKRGLWAAAAMLALFVYLRRMSRAIALAAALLLMACALACWGLYGWLGPQGLAWLAGVGLIAALTGLCVGQFCEDKPARGVFRAGDLITGLAWVVAGILRRLGFRY